MRAALVETPGAVPQAGEMAEPTPVDGELLVRVRAAALSNLVKGQAAGRHYSSDTKLPFAPGHDGVGTLPDGKRVYFFGPRAPFGTMAEVSLAGPGRMIALPDSLDDVTAAALGNPGIASWGALVGRAKLQPGETVLVNGATGVSGQQAVQVAKHLGAKRVIATGRNQASLEKLKSLGADETISLEQPDAELTKAFREVYAQGVDVVLDYLWGRSAEFLLKASAGRGAPDGEPRRRFIQIGSMSGPAITLDAQLLRSSGLELYGSGLGSLSAKAIVAALTRMFNEAGEAKLKIDVDKVPLADVAAAWTRAESGRRVVFTL